MPDRLDPISVFLSCFSIASLGGIANLLRGQKPLQMRVILATLIYSGLTGLVIGLVWFNHYRDTNVYFLIGISGLAGLGGTTLLDVLVQIMSRGGVKISIQPQEDKEGLSDGD